VVGVAIDDTVVVVVSQQEGSAWLLNYLEDLRWWYLRQFPSLIWYRLLFNKFLKGLEAHKIDEESCDN